ncbi:hypothetical protein TNCV_5029301 [Trichonephila clavipes]|nr:hypothetical protein TNCV_5029301 [Trichonephila clavipes]
MASGSYMTPIYSRSQSEVQGDLHKVSFLFRVHINYTEHGRRNTDKETTTQHKAAVYTTTEKRAKRERARFPETSVFIPDEIPDISLIAGKEFRNWEVKDLDPFPDSPRRQKETH